MLGIPPLAHVPLSTPTSRATDIGRGPNLPMGSGRAPGVPRSREREERPAAGREKMPKDEKTSLYIYVYYKLKDNKESRSLTTVQAETF